VQATRERRIAAERDAAGTLSGGTPEPEEAPDDPDAEDVDQEPDASTDEDTEE
jgi:hypothetical protein